MEGEKNKLDADSVDVITLNVGGEKFVTRLQTLKKYPNSLFMRKFSSTHEPKKNQDESYFIDRDGTLVRYLINYMRTGKTTSRMKELAEELIEEAKFFGLPELVEALSQNDCKQDDEIVKLNVGGETFQTSSSTLQKDPNSMLAAMFSGRFEAVRHKDGAYFIDRDGTHFRHILNFLRMGSIPNEIIAEAGEELAKEAEFYNLQSLVETITTLKPVKINNDGEFLTTTMEIFCRHGFADLFFNMNQEIPRIGGTFFVSPPVMNLAEIIMFLKEEEIPMDRLLDVKINLFSSAIDLDFKYLQNYLTDFTESKIIEDKKEYIDILKAWLRGKGICPLPCLIYSTEERGWQPKDFYRHCSNMGPTLILVESNFGCIFGGYTSLDWSTVEDTASTDSNCFLFSLKSFKWDKPVIMPASIGEGGVSFRDSYPSFVDAMLGCPLSSQLSLSSSPCCKVTTGFSVPGDFGSNAFLAGEEEFQIRKLEVFAI